jgi:hypothetical protein
MLSGPLCFSSKIVPRFPTLTKFSSCIIRNTDIDRKHDESAVTGMRKMLEAETEGQYLYYLDRATIVVVHPSFGILPTRPLLRLETFTSIFLSILL